MRARVWISTYRRPEIVQRCLKSLAGSPLPLMVLHPYEEQHTFPAGVMGVRLLPEASGVGAGVPRAIAGNLALMYEDDAMVYLDDDVVCPDNGAGLRTLIQALDENPEIGAVTCKDRGHEVTNSEKYSDGPLHLTNGLIHCSVIRMSAYEQAGGFDGGMGWGEDKDLCLRLQVGGWAVVQHRGVEVEHRRFQEGGMIAQKSALADTRKYIERVVNKFPAGYIRATKRSFTFRSPSQLRRLQEAYAAGNLEMTAERVQFKS